MQVREKDEENKEYSAQRILIGASNEAASEVVEASQNRSLEAKPYSLPKLRIQIQKIVFSNRKQNALIQSLK